jgi:hypothetical protein
MQKIEVMASYLGSYENRIEHKNKINLLITGSLVFTTFGVVVVVVAGCMVVETDEIMEVESIRRKTVMFL